VSRDDRPHHSSRVGDQGAIVPFQRGNREVPVEVRLRFPAAVGRAGRVASAVCDLRQPDMGDPGMDPEFVQEVDPGFE